MISHWLTYDTIYPWVHQKTFSKVSVTATLGHSFPLNLPFHTHTLKGMHIHTQATRLAHSPTSWFISPCSHSLPFTIIQFHNPSLAFPPTFSYSLTYSFTHSQTYPSVLWTPILSLSLTLAQSLSCQLDHWCSITMITLTVMIYMYTGLSFWERIKFMKTFLVDIPQVNFTFIKPLK